MTPIDRQVQAAAAPTLERIRADRDRVPVQLESALEYLEAHLFDAELDGKRLMQACGVRDHTWATEFHRAVSLPPYGYIEDCRLEIGSRLLADTDLKIWQIAQRLGYSALQVFSRAFERWSGLRPSVYRRQMQAQSGEAEMAGDEAPCLVLRPEMLLRAMQGDLARNEADELARCLSDLYPESFQLSTSSSSGRCEECQPSG